jgi:hypothetical protein
MEIVKTQIITQGMLDLVSAILPQCDFSLFFKQWHI